MEQRVQEGTKLVWWGSLFCVLGRFMTAEVIRLAARGAGRSWKGAKKKL